MKQFMGTLAATVISLYSIAQAPNVKITLSGKVIDGKNSKPIASATVKVGNTFIVADEGGNFKVSNLKKGTYSLTVSCVGYEEYQQEVSTDTFKPNTIIPLTPSPLFLQSLEIKALRASDKAPFTKTNITKEELAKTNLGQDLPYMLKQTPSTVINSDAGNGVGYTNIYIRGVDATRINVTLNGIPYNDAESQGTYFVDLPDFTSSLNSIQVQRGVGPSSMGTGSFGAAINLQTNEYNEKAYTELNNSFGSFNTIKNTLKLGTGLINNHFTVDARLSSIVSDGYRDRAATNLQSYAVTAAYITPNSSVRFNVFSGKEKTYQAWAGVPDYWVDSVRTYNPNGAKADGSFYNNQTDNYQQNHYQLFYNQQINKKISFNTAFFFTPGIGYYQSYIPNTPYAGYGLTSNTDTADLINQQWLDNKFYGQIVSLQYKKEKDQLIIGGGWNRYEGGHYGHVIWAQKGGFAPDYVWYNDNATKTEANIYAKLEHQITNHLLLYADLQYKYLNYEVNGFDSDTTKNIHTNWHFFNPKVGATYTNKGWTAYVSAALSNKEPNRTDFEYALNYTPKAEQLSDYELGIEKHINNNKFGATLYYMNYKDQLVLTGKLNDNGYPIRTNAPKSYRAGVELQASVAITNWLNINGNLTLSKNRIKQFTEYIYKYDDNYYAVGDSQTIPHNNTTISFSPNTIASLTVTATPTQFIEFSLINKYVGKQYLDNAQNEDRTLGDYFTQDCRAILTLHTPLLKEVKLIAQINNVLNRYYYANGTNSAGFYPEPTSVTGYSYSSSNSYYPMAGRNYMIGLNVRL